MPSISKSKLKANMLRIFRYIENTGEEMIVTDHNRPGFTHSIYWTKKDSGRSVQYCSGQSHLSRGRQYTDYRRMERSIENLKMKWI